MKRIDIHYGGHLYSIGGREFTDLHTEIADGVAAGRHWLVVNDGDGQRRDAHLVLAPGARWHSYPSPTRQTHRPEELAVSPSLRIVARSGKT